MTSREIIKNKWGAFEIKHKPTASELNDYYAKKYYVDGTEKANKYQKSYSPEEITFFKSVGHALEDWVAATLLWKQYQSTIG